MPNQDIGVLSTKSYSADLRIALQKNNSLYRQGCTDLPNPVGEGAAVVNFVDPVAMRKRNTRGAVKQIADTNHRTRWMSHESYTIDSDIIDSLDKRNGAQDPTSQYMMNQAAAAKRQFDNDFIDRGFGNALTGKDGTSTVALPSSQIITSTAKFVIDDITQAIIKFQENEILIDPTDPSQLFLALSPKAFAQFYNFDEVKDKDFGNTFFDGQTFQVREFMGINIVLDNFLPGTDAARELIMWRKQSMYCGIWKDIHGTVERDPGREEEPDLVTTYMDIGFSRVEEEGVVKIITDTT